MEHFNCAHCNEYGFCRIYSDSDVDIPCPGNGDCDRYVEGEDG